MAFTVVFHSMVEDKNRGQEPRSRAAVESRGREPRSRTAASSHWSMVFLPSYLRGGVKGERVHGEGRGLVPQLSTSSRGGSFCPVSWIMDLPLLQGPIVVLPLQEATALTSLSDRGLSPYPRFHSGPPLLEVVATVWSQGPWTPLLHGPIVVHPSQRWW